jgi:hypothetical protein
VLGVCLSAPLGAAPQQPTGDLPISLERIRAELEKTPAPRLKLDVPVELPVATFRTRVDQRVWVPSLEEVLRKEFTLTYLQRQSADWASRCCGINLTQLAQSIKRALQQREVRKIREEIARELAELEAARNQRGAPEKK